MSSGSKGSSTTVQKTEPWSGQMPYLEEVFAEAQRLYGRPGPAYYPGRTVAALPREAQLALAARTARARRGSDLNRGAAAELGNTLGGSYLAAGNPYFAQMAERVGQQVTPAVNAQFSRAGRYGSGAHGKLLADSLSSEIGELAYRNFADERQRMLQAAGLAPEVAQQDYADLDQLAAAGAVRQRQAQAEIDAAIARYNYRQNLPWLKLGQYSDAVHGQFGQTTTTTERADQGWAPLLGGLFGGLLSVYDRIPG
jgi:hypothetical protein